MTSDPGDLNAMQGVPTARRCRICNAPKVARRRRDHPEDEKSETLFCPKCDHIEPRRTTP